MSGTTLRLPFKHFILATETPIKFRTVILNLEIKGQRLKEALGYFPRPSCLSANVGTAIQVFQALDHSTTEVFILVRHSVKMLSHDEDAGCNSPLTRGVHILSLICPARVHQLPICPLIGPV